MTSDPKNPTDLRKADRIPFETNVHIEFEKFSGFISEYSTNLSEGGMFIRSDQPASVGTVLSFEFKLKDNFTLIQGLGEVAWVRQGTQPGEPRGMGIRFREISPQSRQLIATMVANHQSKGGKVFDLADEGSNRTLPFFDTGETEIGVGEAQEKPLDPSNLEALFDVPLDADAPPAPPPSEATRKDLEELFAVDKDDKGGWVAEIAKKADPERKESTRPEVELKIKSSDRPKWIFVLVGFLITAGAGGYFFKDPILDTLRVLSLPYVSQWLAEPTPTPAPPTPPPAAPSPVDKAPAAEGTPSDSTPLDAVVDAASPAPVETPTATATALPSTPAAPFKKVVSITWSTQGDALLLRIETDGAIPQERFASMSIAEGAPREVVKLLGVSEKFRRLRLPVSTMGVSQIRVGHHPGADGLEVHLVVDLKNPDFRIRKSEVDGKTLVLTFAAAPLAP